jgi:hypothetical protein
VIFDELTPEEAITAIIEFVRFADMCGVAVIETLIAKHIKATIIANPAPPSKVMRDPDINAYCLTSQHFISAAFLPEGHPVTGYISHGGVCGISATR